MAVTAAKAATDVIIEHLVDDSGMLEVPVNPYKVAQALGIEVLVSELDSSTAGLIVSEEAGTKIFLNRADPEVRKRFTLAHEVGHFIRHRELDDAPFGYVDHRKDMGGATDSEEVWSNRFAAALLMPAQAVRHFYGEGWSAQRLAREFNVSEVAMGYRLKNLGLA